MYLKILLIIAALSTSLPAVAREIYNQHSQPIKKGIISSDTLPAYFSDCQYHLRIDIPPRCKSAKWSVSLGYQDSTYSTITLVQKGAGSDDIDYGQPLDITVCDFSSDSVLNKTTSYQLVKEVNPSCSGWSFMITRLPGEPSANCIIGQTTPLLSFPVRTEGLHTIVSESLTDLRLSRLSLFATETDDLTDVSISSLNDLKAHLLSPTATTESYWRYLDRDTDPRKLNLGGNYQLATVISTDGSIEILYLGGADKNKSMWCPLMLKGRLIPTVFIDHYDLVWYDPFGTKIQSETSADIIDGAILKLNFPLYGGSLRFQKTAINLSEPESR